MPKFKKDKRSIDQYSEKYLGITKINVQRLCYEWKIHNFSICNLKVQEKMNSPVFSSMNDKKIQWCLRMYPMGSSEQYKGYVSLYLYLMRKEPEGIKVKFTFCIICNNVEDKLSEKTNVYNYTLPACIGYNEFIKRDYLLDNKNHFLPNDVLTIKCYLEIGMNIQQFGTNVIANDIDASKNQVICKKFEELLDNKELTDIILIASGKEFHAHKVILAARSPVFLAMLKSDMKEKAQNKIEFVDFDSNVLNELLRYIYTGKSNNIEKYSYDLLAIAEKYALEGLKTECEQYLSNCFSTTNAIDILELADRYNCQKLKGQVINFMINYKEEVIELPQFKALKDSKPSLVSDLLLAMVQKR